MISLETCPQLDEAIIRWKHFWKQDLYKRPVVMMGVLKEDVASDAIVPIYDRRYYDAVQGNWENRVAMIKRYLRQMDFFGDGIPMFAPDYGPDQWALFFGKGEFRFSETNLTTNWVDPIIDDWGKSLPLRIDPANEVLNNIVKYAEFLAQQGQGQFLVSQIDAHSNADALSALRGTERFLMDIYSFHIEKSR